MVSACKLVPVQGGQGGERVNEPGALPAFGSKSEVSGFILVS